MQNFENKNVLSEFVIGNFDAIKLCDFGVSLPLTVDGNLDRIAAGKDATYIGTKIWSPPEIWQEMEELKITDKADIFAYGLTLWEMMAMTTPFTTDFSEESDSSFDEEAYEEQIEQLIGTFYKNLHNRRFSLSSGSIFFKIVIHSEFGTSQPFKVQWSVNK